jgi:hypothetical protein
VKLKVLVVCLEFDQSSNDFVSYAEGPSSSSIKRVTAVCGRPRSLEAILWPTAHNVANEISVVHIDPDVRRLELQEASRRIYTRARRTDSTVRPILSFMCALLYPVATSRKVVGSRPDEMTFFNLPTPSGRTRPKGLLSL